MAYNLKLRPRGNMTHKLLTLGMVLCELCLLLMLYSATLLAPVPFGFVRIGCILMLAAASCAFAYFAGSRLASSVETEQVRLKRVLSKPPFIIWVIVAVVIVVQLANGLFMVYLANRK